MTPQERKVFELALEALEREARGYAVHDQLQIPRSMRDAIVAIKEALAQPEQEPVAWAVKTIGGRKWHSIHASKGSSDKWLEYRIKEYKKKREEYEQIPLYTFPPFHELSDDEMLMIYGQEHEGKKYSLGRMVQQALKGKNT